MGKISVSILAKQLGVEPKVAIARLKEIGVDAKTATSQVDEDVVARLTAPKPRENGTDEIRVASNVIRRRAKVVVTEAVDASPAIEESTPKRAETADQREVSSVSQIIETTRKDDVSEIVETVSVVKLEVAVDPQKTGPNQARILGRMEIPGVTSRPTRVVTKDTPVPQRTAPPRPVSDAAQRRPTPGADQRKPSPGYEPKRPVTGADQKKPTNGYEPRRQASPTPLAPATELDRSRMKQVQLAPLAPGGDNRRGAKKDGPGYGDGGKGGKKGVPPKKKEQPRKNESVIDKRERAFDPVYKGAKRKGGKERAPDTRKTEITIPKAIKRIIKISESITVGELAKRLGIKANDLIKSLMKMGMMVTINHPLDHDTAVILASEYSYEVENVAVDLDEILESLPDAPETLEKRPPVVTIMGHVDHGKTSLLDAIREANVIAGEAGGITQHIGAYDVELNGRKITFLDTPGHEAFTAMRARGAKVTDIVVLVVAADDGVMPQTREAINHSKAATVPIIVAINKIDKPDSNPERVKRELTEQGLVSSEWGGDVTMVEVSAKKRLNLEELLEMILLQADLMELKANPNKQAKGTIVEAKLDKGRGPVATVLVQEGTLKAGDYCVVGVHSGRVRAMQNDRGEKILEAGPSMPVELVGLSGVPEAGDVFVSMKDEKQAKEIATLRQIKHREVEFAKHTKLSLEDLYKRIQSGEVKDLNVVVKG
ncbi:MAG: translation initiation factor IF-2, partial [Deltaproteobacteria bacterium]